MSEPRTPLVAMRNIHKAFGGVHAVEDVSINLYPGEVVALLGHNGAGKSTLMKMLAGAYPIDSGEVLINGDKANIRTPVDAQHCWHRVDLSDAGPGRQPGRRCQPVFGP